MRRTGISLLTAVAILSLGTLSARSESPSVLTRHVREAVLNGKAVPEGRLPFNQTLQLDLVLPLRDSAGLERFLDDVYNPNSGVYRHFVTPKEFTERFGPTQKDYDAVLRFAAANELKVVGGSRDGMDVQVRGTVS